MPFRNDPKSFRNVPKPSAHARKPSGLRPPALRQRRTRRPATLLRNVRLSGSPASDPPTSGLRLTGNRLPSSASLRDTGSPTSGYRPAALRPSVLQLTDLRQSGFQQSVYSLLTTHYCSLVRPRGTRLHHPLRFRFGATRSAYDHLRLSAHSLLLKSSRSTRSIFAPRTSNTAGTVDGRRTNTNDAGRFSKKRHGKAARPKNPIVKLSACSV